MTKIEWLVIMPPGKALKYRYAADYEARRKTDCKGSVFSWVFCIIQTSLRTRRNERLLLKSCPIRYNHH